mmetsp:Transcript_34281/g.58189  ORF Transcript_34281/g.58189 Transcript_34281/m.58189 type:complete len:94 (-) Transcript_34281:380-661(-)
MNFNYSTRSKSYMVDGHEHEEQRKNRKKLTTEYTAVIEPRCHRWVQMSLEEFDSLPKKDEILNGGYTYKGVDGSNMVEYHVDDHECQNRMVWG